MTVEELMERLGDFEPTALVRLAHQPSWPLAFTVAGVTSDYEMGEPDETVVWIAEGGHPRDGSPYAPGEVWDHAA